MPTCRGNRGNLLQHWTLCELIQILGTCLPKDSHLLYIDAYPMAPLAPMREKADQTRAHFLHVRNELPGQRSTYETSWQELAHKNPDLYPSSLVFVSRLWKSCLSVCLSEIDLTTHEEIASWLNSPERTNRFEKKRVDLGDWRERLQSCDVGVDPDLVFMSFDPNMYDRRDLPEEDRKPENMYRPDLYAVVSLCERWDCPIAVQMSTYSANNNNPQKLVEEQITKVMTKGGGFSDPVIFRADNQMMSLAYVRGAESLISKMVLLVEDLDHWLENSKPGR
jgi:hypothetical protein